METIIVIAVAAAIIVAIVIAWILSANKARAAFKEELNRKEADLIKKEAELQTANALRENEKALHEAAMKELKDGQEKAIEAAKTALALENEKL